MKNITDKISKIYYIDLKTSAMVRYKNQMIGSYRTVAEGLRVVDIIWDSLNEEY